MSLKTHRTEVAELLTAAGLRAEDHVPGRLVPPIAMVVPGSPYLEAGATFGSKSLRLDVWLVSAVGDNPVAADALDEQVSAAVAVLEGDDWAIEQVAQPFPYSPQNATYLTTIVSIRGDITT